MASDDLCGCAVERLWQERGEAWEAENAAVEAKLARAEAAISTVRAALDEARGVVARFRSGHNPECECEWDKGAMSVVESLAAALDSSGTPEPEAEIWIDRGRMGGLPCVYGSRVPIETLVRYAEHDNDEVALEAYPSATAQTLAAARWFLTQWQRLDSSGTVEDAPDGGHLWGSDASWCRRCGMVRGSIGDVSKWPCTGKLGVFRNAPPSAQLPEERSDEGQKKPMPPCPHCGPGYRYGDEGCRHMIPPSVSGLPVDGETT